MGKRSSFERIDKDQYQTIDPKAVEILNTHLWSKTIFAEPCAGEGYLVTQLASKGHVCYYSGDINDGDDAFNLTEEDLGKTEYIITNPPWTRSILHPMIEHFVTLRPTWLLFDSDWCYTNQASIYIKDYCTKIVAVGRLKWIPNTTMSGKDNCSWYLFENDKDGVTEFYGK